MTTDRTFEPGDIVRRTDGGRDYIVTGYTRSGMVEARPVHGRPSTVIRPEGGWEMVTPVMGKSLLVQMPRISWCWEGIIESLHAHALPADLIGCEEDDQ